MNPVIYQILHLTGLFMLFLGYGALLARSMAAADAPKVRKLGSVTAGIGLVLILVAGFGMIARLYGNQFQGWMIAKALIWLALGGLIVLINRKPGLAPFLWWGLIALGILASSLVYLRPF